MCNLFSSRDDGSLDSGNERSRPRKRSKVFEMLDSLSSNADGAEQDRERHKISRRSKQAMYRARRNRTKALLIVVASLGSCALVVLYCF